MPDSKTTATRAMTPPKRRFEITLKLSADDERAIAHALQHLANEASRERLSPQVSGGYDSGYIVEMQEYPEQTHDKWAAELDAYLKWDRARLADLERTGT